MIGRCDLNQLKKVNFHDLDYDPLMILMILAKKISNLEQQTDTNQTWYNTQANKKILCFFSQDIVWLNKEETDNKKEKKNMMWLFEFCPVYIFSERKTKQREPLNFH